MAGVKYGKYLNIDKYRNEFDTEEQWTVKRNFMLTYMHEFTEDRLVCLAQVLFNIKYLGCTYPEKTMDLVERLSTSVKKIDPAEDESKLRLKRTLVQAQTAASAKVQRTSYINIAERSVASSSKANSASFPPAQRQQLATVTKQEPATVSKPSASGKPLPLSKLNLQEVAHDNINVQLLKDMQSIKGPIKALVLIQIGDEQSFTMFQRNAGLWKRPFRLTWKKMGGGIWSSTVQFDGLLLSDLSGHKKVAKRVACNLAMYKLQTQFYTVRIERGSLAEYYFIRTDGYQRTGPICYDVNFELHPSNELEAVGSVEDYKKVMFFAKIEDAEKYDETNRNDRAVIITKLRNIIDEYDRSLDEEREMVFVRQYDFEVYREVFELVTAPGEHRNYGCKFIGGIKNRTLVVFRSDKLIKLPWRLIHGVLIECKDQIGGFKIHPPGTIPMPDLEGMDVVQSPKIWSPPK